MRLWSLHPSYLDARGLVALWRESLLAQAVLRGETRGYTHHPQLIRFRQAPEPVAAIGAYLVFIYKEAQARATALMVRRLGLPIPGIKYPVQKISFILNGST